MRRCASCATSWPAPDPVRIGINTGEVVAGGGEALVTGDAVNVAARLEQAARRARCWIGATTYRLTRDAVACEPLDGVSAKGKSAPLVAHRLGLSGPTRRRSPAARLELIGRGLERDAVGGLRTGRLGAAAATCSR